MTDYVKAFTTPGALYHGEAIRLVGDIVAQATITDGVIRWNSNNSVIPADCVALAVHLGLPVDVEACDRERSIDLDKFFNDYNPVYSEETLAEIRNEFGPNAAVVNVITGKRII